MNKIKIMHVAQAAGGVDRYIQSLLKYMNKDKFENLVIFSNDYRKSDYVDYVNVYETVNMKRNIGLHDFKAIIQVRRLIKKYKPDIVYAHSSKAGGIARVANIGLHNFCIYNPHGWSFNMRCSKLKKKIYVYIERLASLLCDEIICISRSEKESALKMNICKNKKINVIYNGIDIGAYQAPKNKEIKRKDIGIPDKAFVIGMVGRISEQKSPDIFIKVAKEILKKIPESYFIIVGNGEMEEEIKQYAIKEGFLDKLHITGWVDNSMQYIKLFDVACLLSRWEGFGLVLPEYMLAKKPIVASNVDAIPNIIIDGDNGVLVKVDDVEDTVKAIFKIYKEPEFKYRIVQNASVDVVELYDVKRVSKQHEIEFFKLVHEK